GNPDVTAAFGTTGNSIQTWSGAARKAGRDVVIIGMDYIRQNLDLVKSGAAYGIVAQPLYEESAKVAELLGDLAQGKTVPYSNPLPAKVITAADLDPYYKMLDSAGQ
ncbi:MAG: sugar ABC transporter substrate-binding protein, partial [Mesorhizobium sp.]